MKKFFAILALVTLLMVPMSAMALSPVAEADLAAITGQSGVSINLDVNVNMTLDIAAWGDSNGFGSTYSSAGYVGLASLNITNLHLRARDFNAQDWMNNFSNTDMQTGADEAASELVMSDANWNAYAAMVGGNDMANALAIAFTNHVYNSKFLTIDVGTSGTGDTAVTKVKIGIPTLYVKMDSMTANVNLYGSTTVVSNNPNKVVPGQPDTANAQQMGQLYVGDLVALVGSPAYDGGVFIYGHTAADGGQGVNVGFENVAIEAVTIGSAAWGDCDGLPLNAAWASAGWVGLKDAKIQGILVNGDLSVDVSTYDYATINADVAAGGDSEMAVIAEANTQPERTVVGYALQKGMFGKSISATYVHLGLNNFTVGIDQMYAPVALGSTGALTTGATTGELGVLYLKGLSATVANGSWVDILAH